MALVDQADDPWFDKFRFVLLTGTMASRRKHKPTDQAIAATAPFLRRVYTIPDRINSGQFPFTLPLFASGLDLELKTPVTFLVGENGTGKSTLLEAIAMKTGFNIEGGSRDHIYSTTDAGNKSALADSLRLSWSPKVSKGFFLRAETFFNFATYIDKIGGGNPRGYQAYGGTSLHHKSHGESFLALFMNRFEEGFFILDEPESALSPQRQLAFLAILSDMERQGKSQFIIATHSPMLITYPGATLLSIEDGALKQVAYQDTEHFQLMKTFLDSPERYFKRLLGTTKENSV